MKKYVSLILSLVLCMSNIGVMANKTENNTNLTDDDIIKITETSVLLQLGYDEAIVYGKRVKLERAAELEQNRLKLPEGFAAEYFAQEANYPNELKGKYVWDKDGLFVISDDNTAQAMIRHCYDKLCLLFGIFVDPSAKNGNGSITRPFDSVEKALERLKTINNEVGFLEGEYPIYFRAGNYQICKTQHIEGIIVPDGTKVVLRPYNDEKVTFGGGVVFRGKEFEKVTQADILNKLPDAAKGRVYRTNLSDYGLKDFGEKVFDVSANPSEMNLIYNGQAMTVARWPNQGVEKTGRMLVVNGSDGAAGFEFVFDDPQIEKWRSAQNPWIWGTFEWEWFAQSHRVQKIDLSKKSIRTVDNHRFTPAENRNWYIYNLLEELDRAGEYYFDKNTGYLYFYPGIDDVRNGSFQKAEISFCALNDNMFELKGCKNLEFQNIIFENVGKNMLVMNDCENTSVSGCMIRNCGDTAISAADVKNVKIIGTDIYNIGGKGVYLKGGNRDDLTAGNNEILNCRIYKFGQTVRTYASGISLEGCGNRAAHNELFDFPHTAISNSYSNNNVFEYNEIHDGLIDGANDAGVVYVSVDPTAFGNVLRNNYFHDIYVGMGSIYIDDATAGYTVENNLFYNVNRSIFMHGSNSCRIVGNITLNSNQDSISVTNMSHDTRWDPKTLTPDSGSSSKSVDYMNCAKRVPFTSDLWKQTYPEVEEIISRGVAKLPLGNEIHDNISISKKNNKTVFVNETALGAVDHHDDPSYVKNVSIDDIKNKNPEIMSLIPNFDKIDFDNIGLYQDEIRTKLPVIEDFDMSYPYNKQTELEASSVTFNWTDANATRKYRFVLALDKDFRKIVQDRIVFGTSHTVNGLRYNKTRYYWRVEALSNNQLALYEPNKKSNSEYFCFTTKKAETLDLTKADNALYQAGSTYAKMQEGESAGEFFAGARSEYGALIEALKKDLKDKNLSQRKLNKILEDFALKETAVLSKRNQTTVTVNDMLNQEDWSFIQNTVSFTKSAFLWTKGSGDDPQAAGYSKRKLESYENFKANMTFDISDGTWQGISMRASAPATVAWSSNSQYLVIVKSDVIEFQKWHNNSQKIYETYENKWIRSGEKHLIDFEINNNDGSFVTITFKVDGEALFSYEDRDDPIINKGYLQFYNANAGKTLKVEAVE